MPNIEFSLSQLAHPPKFATMTLGRHQLMVIQRGGSDLATLKKARARVAKLNATLSHDPQFDAVAEVRKMRRSKP